MSEVFSVKRDGLTHPGRKCPKIPPLIGAPSHSHQLWRRPPSGHPGGVFEALGRLLFCEPAIFVLWRPQLRKPAVLRTQGGSAKRSKHPLKDLQNSPSCPRQRRQATFFSSSGRVSCLFARTFLVRFSARLQGNGPGSEAGLLTLVQSW
jgi:hypothetical protein